MDRKRVYQSFKPKNPYITEVYHLNFVEVIVWCSLSMRGFIETFFFYNTVTAAVYLKLFQESIKPSICEQIEKEDYCFQQDEAHIIVMCEFLKIKWNISIGLHIDRCSIVYFLLI